MSTSTAPAGVRWSTSNKAGFVLALVINVANIISIFFPTPDGEVGPPIEILIADAALGAAGIVATVIAWRTGSKVAARFLAAVLVIQLVTALPAFFVDIDAGVKVLAGVFALLTVVACVMIFAPNRDREGR